MPRLITGSLLAVFLIAAWAVSRTGFAQDPAVPETADREAGVPATETPAKGQSTAADDDATKKAEADDEKENEKPADAIEEKPVKTESAPPAAADPRGTRPGSPRDRRGGRSSPAEEAKPVVADFGDSDKKPAAGEKGRGSEPVLIFNFKYAPWDLVLKRFAEVAKLNLSMDEIPVGTFSYYDKSPHTVTEALDVINGHLIKQGFILLRRHKALDVANFSKGIPQNQIPTIPLAELSKRGQYELLSVVIPLGNIDAKSAAEEIKDLLGPYPQGKAIPMVNSNQLLVTDLGSHLQYIRDILSDLGTVATKGQTLRSFKLANISATEAERILRDLFALPSRGAAGRTTPNEQQATARGGRPTGNEIDLQGRGGGRGGRGGWPGAGGGWNGGGGPGGVWNGGGGPGGGWNGAGGFPVPGGGDNPGGMDPQAMMQAFMNRGGRGAGRGGDGSENATQAAAPPRLSMTIDPRQNTLLVTCSVDDMRLVEDAIKTIDVAESGTGRADFSKSENVPQLKVYPLENADPAIVADVLLSTVPGLIIRDDAKTRGIIVYATRAEQEQVEKYVKLLDSGTGDSMAAFSLRSWDAVAAATSLKGLYSNNKVDPPSIEADSLGRRLMVRGTPDQVSQIKRFLGDIGEDASVAVASNSSGGPLRVIQPSGRSAAEIMALIERMYPASERSFIRIVPPSEMGVPSFQPRQIDEPRRGGSSSYRRSAPAYAPAGSREEPAAERRESDFNSGAAPGSDGKASGLKGDRPIVPARRYSLGLFPETTLATPVRSTAGERLTSPLVRASARPEGKAMAEPGIDELSQQLEEALRDEEESQQADGSQEAAEPEEPADEVPSSRAGPGSRQVGEVRMTVSGDRILIAGDDMAALDRMEKMIQLLSVAAPPKSKWTVYYCRVADATETANMLGVIFSDATVARTTPTTGGGLFGGGLFGQRNTTTDTAALSSLSKGGALRIIPELRSNALFISGDESAVDQVMDALRVLDASELPQSLKDRVPRMIPVEHADVTEIAEIVREVYKEHLEGGQPNQQQGGNRGGGMNPFMGGGMFGNFGQPQQQQGRGGARNVLLSIGVDTRTNHLVVSASDSLYRQVEELVKSLDDSANQAHRTVRVVSLQNSNSMVVQQTLGSLLGKVKTTSPARGGRTTAESPNGTARGQTPAPDLSANPNGDAQQVDPAALFMQQQMMRGMMRGGGGFGGGGFGGGGQGGGMGGRGGNGGGRGGGFGGGGRGGN